MFCVIFASDCSAGDMAVLTLQHTHQKRHDAFHAISTGAVLNISVHVMSTSDYVW